MSIANKFVIFSDPEVPQPLQLKIYRFLFFLLQHLNQLCLHSVERLCPLLHILKRLRLYDPSSVCLIGDTTARSNPNRRIDHVPCPLLIHLQLIFSDVPIDSHDRVDASMVVLGGEDWEEGDLMDD